jgi:deoxyribodipyrimidine photolyase-related protein
MSFFLVFPNHLFAGTTAMSMLKSFDHVYIVEEPVHFYDAIYRPFKVHKTKLAYMRACMKGYERLLKRHKVRGVKYINYSDVSKMYKTLQDNGDVGIHCWEPSDRVLQRKYADLGITLHIHNDTPQFIAHKEEQGAFLASVKSAARMSNESYYGFIKGNLGILQGVKNMDTENRLGMNKDREHKYTRFSFKTRTTSALYNEAVRYVANHHQFSQHVGDMQHVDMFPITHAEAERQFRMFLEHRMRSFGPFEDAIHKTEPFLYHSCISAALNCGLITPEYVARETWAWHKLHPEVGMQNIEGFLRQVIGWREYMYMIYCQFYDEVVESNVWKHDRKLDWQKWRTGTTGNEVVDTEITKLLEYGYGHHIVRLMVFLNMMVLCRIRPQDIQQWFMELCAIDAWDWVMVSNIWAMGGFTSRFMRKPYLSTSSYILNMSNYTKGAWCETWNALFYAFLHDHKHDLKGSAQVYLRNLRYFENKTTKEQDVIMRKAHEFIHGVSH